jgi:hypothetical protein
MSCIVLFAPSNATCRKAPSSTIDFNYGQDKFYRPKIRLCQSGNTAANIVGINRVSAKNYLSCINDWAFLEHRIFEAHPDRIELVTKLIRSFHSERKSNPDLLVISGEEQALVLLIPRD